MSVDSLPSTFDTPMFWGERDLKELDGTSIQSENFKHSLPLPQKLINVVLQVKSGKTKQRKTISRSYGQQLRCVCPCVYMLPVFAELNQALMSEPTRYF